MENYYGIVRSLLVFKLTIGTELHSKQVNFPDYIFIGNRL